MEQQIKIETFLETERRAFSGVLSQLSLTIAHLNRSVVRVRTLSENMTSLIDAIERIESRLEKVETMMENKEMMQDDKRLDSHESSSTA